MQITCAYCGELQENSREHVVQESLGGVDTLTNVCKPCNFRLAANDRVLAVDSPLSLFVRRELAGVGPYAWDKDERQKNLLLDAKTMPGMDGVSIDSQLIFERENVIFYCSNNLANKLGSNEVLRRFFTRLRRAYGHYKIYGPMAKKKNHKYSDMIKLSKLGATHYDERYPPRVCCNDRNLDEDYEKSVMFLLKFSEDKDKFRVLDALSKSNFAVNPEHRTNQYVGSNMPKLHVCYSHNQMLQALMKIGLNILNKFCRKTEVNSYKFKEVTSIILEPCHYFSDYDASRFGFVQTSNERFLNCPKMSHKFRLTHNKNKNKWDFYASFFGGNISCFVEFQGPNLEDWATLDVIQPYKQPMLQPIFDIWYCAISVTTSINPSEIITSFKFKDVHSNLLLNYEH